MKLYTEKQMRQCYEGVLQNVGTSIKQSDLPKVDKYINSLTPIELPSDKEIEKELFYQKQVLNPYPTEEYAYTAYEKGFMDCAQLMRDKIQGGNQ
jgi:hypothetical protein